MFNENNVIMNKKDLFLLLGILVLVAFSLKPSFTLTDSTLKLGSSLEIPPDDKGTGLLKHKFFFPAKAYELDVVELAARHQIQNEVLARYKQ